MRPIPTDATRFVVCVSVCLLSTLVSSAKTYELIEMSLKGGRSTHVGQGTVLGEEAQGRHLANTIDRSVRRWRRCKMSLPLV